MEYLIVKTVDEQGLQITTNAKDLLENYLQIFTSKNFREISEGTNRSAIDLELITFIFSSGYTEISNSLNVYNFSDKSALIDLLKEHDISYSDEKYLFLTNEQFINQVESNIRFTKDASIYFQEYVSNYLVNFLRLINKEIITINDVQEKINMILNKRNTLSVISSENLLSNYIDFEDEEAKSYLNLLYENIIFQIIGKSVEIKKRFTEHRFIDHRIILSSIPLLFDFENLNIYTYCRGCIRRYDRSDKSLTRMEDFGLTINVKIIDHIISRYFDFEQITVRGRICIAAIIEFFMKGISSTFEEGDTLSDIKLEFSLDQQYTTICRNAGISVNKIFEEESVDSMNICSVRNFDDDFLTPRITENFLNDLFEEEDFENIVSDSVLILENQV